MGTIASAGLTQTDVLRLGRVIRALAAAGLIDECYLFVRGPGPGSETFEGRERGVRPPRAPQRSHAAGAPGSKRRP